MLLQHQLSPAGLFMETLCVCVVTQSFLEKVAEFCIFYDSSVKN